MKQQNPSPDRELVFSTRSCPACQKNLARCQCEAPGAALPAADGPVRVQREKSGRKGRVVTVVRGVPLSASELRKLAKQLKKRCGSGGTVKDGTIEIQGDHCEAVVAALAGRGWVVKRVG